MGQAFKKSDKETWPGWLSSLLHRWNSLLGKRQFALLGLLPNKNNVQ
jgi:hypothetical protein